MIGRTKTGKTKITTSGAKKKKKADGPRETGTKEVGQKRSERIVLGTICDVNRIKRM